MALIKLGAFVTEISGKIGGTIFSRSKGGTYAKNRVIPLNPQTTAQTLVRQAFGAIAQAWRNLTATQRSAFDAAANGYPYQNRLGESKVLSGSALHQQLNLNLNSINAANINSPLAPSTVEDGTITALSCESGGDISLTVLAVGGSTATDWSLEATPSVSNGVSNVSNKFRKIGVIPFASAGLPFDATTLYETVFGLPLVGSNVSFRIKPVNRLTGQSGVAYDKVTVVI